MSFCPNCGHENSAGSHICAYCRNPIPKATGINKPAPSAPVPPARKKSRKKLVCAIVGGVLGLLLVAALVLYLVYLNHPLRKLYNAATKTAQAISSQSEGFENLSASRAALGELLEQKQFSCDLNLESGVEALGVLSFGMELDYDGQAEAADGEIHLGVVDKGALQLPVYFTNDVAQFALPQIFSSTFQMDWQDFVALVNRVAGKTLLSESMVPFPDEEEAEAYDLTKPFDKLWKSCKGSFIRYALSVDLEELGVSTVSGHEWTRYRLASNEKKRIEFLTCLKDALEVLLDDLKDIDNESIRDYAEEAEQLLTPMLEVLVNTEDPIVFLDDRGYLVGLTFSNGENNISVRLEGAENPWSAIAMSFDLPDANVDAGIAFRYDDATGAFTLDLRSRDITIPVTGRLCGSDGTPQYALHTAYAGIRVDFSCRFSPPGETPAPLARDDAVVDPTNLSLKNAGKLALEALDALASNKELQGLLETLGIDILSSFGF